MNIVSGNLQFTGSLQKRALTTRIIVHHAAAKTCSIADIHRWHLQNGWLGCGYHYLVRKDGSIYTGRPDDTVGAHALSNNLDSIGICFEGDYEQYDKEMPDKQLTAGRDLIASLQKKYTGIQKIQKHKDVNSTDCPGRYFPFAKLSAVPAPSKPSANTIAIGSKVTLNGYVYVDSEGNGRGQKFSGKSCTVTKLQAGAKCPYHVDGLGWVTAASVTAGGQSYQKPTGNVQSGSRGEGVKWVQAQLNAKGFSCGDVDGICGTKTVAAIKAFQKAKGLAVDGIAGPKTIAALQ